MKMVDRFKWQRILIYCTCIFIVICEIFLDISKEEFAFLMGMLAFMIIFVGMNIVIQWINVRRFIKYGNAIFIKDVEELLKKIGKE